MRRRNMPRLSTSNVWSSYHQNVPPIDLNYNVVSCNMSGNCPLEAWRREFDQAADMGNEILAVIEKDSLHMRCLHLCGEICGTVAASCVGGAIEHCLTIGRFVHCCLLDAPGW